jgi:5-formyltetrahydrofolate cyclo-ligase
MDKADIRRNAMRRRRQLRGRVEKSVQIMDRLIASKPYQMCRTIMFYVAVRSEVATRDHIASAIAEGKNVFVPYCDGDQLRLVLLESLDELAPGAFGIPEPEIRIRQLPTRQGTIDEVELAIVPGVAFGRDGSRLGNGRGYFDRLFGSRTGPTVRLGVGFDCQIFDALPVDPHDIWMDAVITESSVYGPNARLFDVPADGPPSAASSP